MNHQEKIAKKEFAFLSVALLLYMSVFQCVGIIGTIIYSLFSHANKPSLQEQATLLLSNRYIWLILSAICAIIITLRFLKTKPNFQVHQKATLKTILMFFIITQAIQVITSLILIPLNWGVEQIGYSFNEAQRIATMSSTTIPAFIYAVTIGPVTEELFFRGILMPRLEKYGKAFALLMTALFFALFHCNIVQFIFSLLIGILLGYVTQNYSLKASIILHILNNLYSEFTGKGSTFIVTLEAIFLILCCFTSIIILIHKKKKIMDFLNQIKKDMPVIKYFFTTSAVLITIMTFLLFTLRSIVSL